MSQQAHPKSAAEALQLLQKHNTVLLKDQLAGRVMQDQIRPVSPWQHQGIKFESYFLPALHLSGDSLDYFVLDNGRIFFYLADVAGSGTSAALLSMLLKSITREYLYAQPVPIDVTPAAILRHINQRLLTYHAERHITLICGIIDLQHNLLRWSVGGHLPLPVLYSEGKAQFLFGEGQPVGLFEDGQYNDEQMPLPHAFSLSLFSDGVFDVLPEEGLVDSEAALPSLVSAVCGDYKKMIDCLGLANCINMPDDIAILVLSRNLA